MYSTFFLFVSVCLLPHFPSRHYIKIGPMINPFLHWQIVILLNEITNMLAQPDSAAMEARQVSYC